MFHLVLFVGVFYMSDTFHVNNSKSCFKQVCVCVRGFGLGGLFAIVWPVCLFVGLFICLFVCPSVRPSVCLPVCLSVCLFVCLLVCLFFFCMFDFVAFFVFLCLFVCLSHVCESIGWLVGGFVFVPFCRCSRN